MRILTICLVVGFTFGCSKKTDGESSAKPNQTKATKKPAHEEFMAIMAGRVAAYSANQTDCAALNTAHEKWLSANESRLKEVAPKFDTWVKSFKDDPVKSKAMREKYKTEFAAMGGGGTAARNMMRKVRSDCSTKLSKPKSEWFPSYARYRKVIREAKKASSSTR